jgi:hypothetical protein
MWRPMEDMVLFKEYPSRFIAARSRLSRDSELFLAGSYRIDEARILPLIVVARATSGFSVGV